MNRYAWVGAGVALGIAGAAAWAWLAPTEAPPKSARREKVERAEKTEKADGHTKEKLPNTPADPPARYAARISPTPVDAAAPVGAPVPAPATPPNVVVILGCTVRKDQISVYGGLEGVTPFLAGLAARGTTFDDAIAAAPWTRAASTSILTGFYAVSVGMVDPGQGRDQRKLPDQVVTLGEHMAARGYFTLGATANPNLSAAFGFHAGYEVYQPGLPSDWANISGVDVADALLGALEKNRDGGDTRPFYLRAMILDAHSPRNAVGDKLAPYREEDVPERVAQYRYHLHEADQALAHLWKGLQGMGYDATNTVFMFVSDHGEGMNYPRVSGYSHGQYHTPATNHAAWILAGPGVAQNHRVLGLASQVDMVPTLLGVIGKPLEDARAVEGRDWSALVRGEGHVTDYEQVWSDTWFQESNRAAVFTRARQCQDDFGSTARQKAKGIFVPGCHDRFADPLFLHPFDDPDLMAKLRVWRDDRERHLRGVQAENVQIDEATSRQLEILGYRE